jgi:hypothetical protein
MSFQNNGLHNVRVTILDQTLIKSWVARFCGHQDFRPQLPQALPRTHKPKVNFTNSSSRSRDPSRPYLFRFLNSTYNYYQQSFRAKNKHKY